LNQQKPHEAEASLQRASSQSVFPERSSRGQATQDEKKFADAIALLQKHELMPKRGAHLQSDDGYRNAAAWRREARELNWTAAEASRGQVQRIPEKLGERSGRPEIESYARPRESQPDLALFERLPCSSAASSRLPRRRAESAHGGVPTAGWETKSYIIETPQRVRSSI